MQESNDFEDKNIDLVIRLILIVVLFAWCGMIILPFVMPVLWGIILAIALFPVYEKLLTLFKGKKALAGSVTSGILLILLIVPAVWLIAMVIENSIQFTSSLKEETLAIPPPNESVADWPIIGKPVYNAWLMVTENLEEAIKQYKDQLIILGEKFLSALKSVATNFIMLLFSIIISGIVLVSSDRSRSAAGSFSSRIAGKRGPEFIELIVITIRNVAKGILGVAFIQAFLLGTLLLLAKVPFAGIWALLALLLAIIQLPVGIVAIPVVIYLFSEKEPFPAIFWSVLIILTTLIDNVLKPWLMGKGSPVPMLVIFLGAIGGMIMFGFIGLFTGAIVLSLGYHIAIIWMNGSSEHTDLK